MIRFEREAVNPLILAVILLLVGAPLWAGPSHRLAGVRRCQSRWKSTGMARP